MVQVQKQGTLCLKFFLLGKTLSTPNMSSEAYIWKKTTHFAPSKSVLLEMWFFLVVKMGCKIVKKDLLVII